MDTLSLVLAIVIPLLILSIVGLATVSVVLCFCYRRRKSRNHVSIGAENKEADLNISFPLPNPSTYKDEISMDETQHSPGFQRTSASKWIEEPSKEVVKQTKIAVATLDQAGASEMSEKSEKTEKSEKSEKSGKSGRSSRHTRSQRSSKSLPVGVPPSDPNSKPSSKKAEDSSFIKTPGPISAGFTPKIARKIPINKDEKRAQQPTPVSTAKGFVIAPRSEDIVSICDEAAGRTPVVITESMLSSQKTSGEVFNPSTMQTFTPAPDSSISTPPPRRPANPFRQ